MSDENTQSINLQDPRFLAMLAELDDEDRTGTATLQSFKEVLLQMTSSSLRLTIHESKTYFLGRFRGSNTDDQIDLNPHGALQAGVSRVHAQLIMENNKLYIVDLSSSNGTYVGKTRLQPDTPSLLHNGDDLLLGRLRMQITFE